MNRACADSSTCPAISLLRICFVLVVTVAARSVSGDEVLLYYANENRPQGLEVENYQTFAAWLRQIDTEESRKLADGLMSDSVDFPAAVDEEIESMKTVPSGQTQPPIVIFTNQLARGGHCLRIAADGTATKERFECPSTGELVLDGNPLCRGEILAAALNRTAEFYPPADHEYVLITKSHGSSDLAITVRLARDFRKFTREKVEAMLRDPDQADLPDVGISKPNYFNILQDVGAELGMQFRLVFVESCRGTIAPETINDFPTNIQTLFASGDRSLQYQTLNYTKLMNAARRHGSFHDAIEIQLNGKYLRVRRRSSGAPFLWFLPALIVLFVYLMKRRPRGASGSSQDNHN